MRTAYRRDMLAHFVELDDWATVTLRDVANHATLMNQERFKHMCTCGAFDWLDASAQLFQRRRQPPLM